MREKKRVITVLFWQLIVLLGFFFMVIAGNIGASWRYLSPIYLLMCFFLCSCFAGVDSLDKPVIYKTVILFLVLLAVFLTRKNVSELYSGHLEDEAFFEHEYGDMNGLFVVHDKAGENYLYEAAFLWPDESKVYVDKLSVFDETASYDGLFSSDRMLLWTTIDYDYNDVVNRFLEKSKFTDTNEVFVTDTLHVFECYR